MAEEYCDESERDEDANGIRNIHVDQPLEPPELGNRNQYVDHTREVYNGLLTIFPNPIPVGSRSSGGKVL